MAGLFGGDPLGDLNKSLKKAITPYQGSTQPGAGTVPGKVYNPDPNDPAAQPGTNPGVGAATGPSSTTPVKPPPQTPEDKTGQSIRDASPGATSQGPMAGKGYGEQAWESLGAYYGQPGLYEQWAQQQANGSNPYYDRMRKQTMDTMGQQAAARGTYNSGGALAAEGNALGALGAAQFKDMGDLMGGAQQAGLARVGQGLAGANAAEGQMNQRLNQLFNAQAGITAGETGSIAGAYDMGGSQSGNAYQTWLQNMYNTGLHNAQGTANSQQFWLDLAKMAAMGAAS